MEISSQVLPQSRRQYTVSLSELETAEFFERALGRLAIEVKIAGFRPGKAPAHLVREQLKPEAIREEAYSLAVQAAWKKVVSGLKEGPIEDPAVEIGEFSDGKVAKLVFSFDVRPQVTVKNWQNIKVTGINNQPIGDEQINEVLSSLSKGHAKTIVKLTPAKAGDKMEVTFEGSLGGVKKDKLSSKHFPLILGEKTVIPGFAEQLTGLKKGETKKFKLPFPKDHFDKELAGQTIDFAVTVEEVFEVILPEVSVDFAKKFGHDTIAQLKKAIGADLDKERQEERFIQQKAKWLAEFEKCVSVELPKSLVEAEVNRARQSWLDFLASRNLQAEAWLLERKIKQEDLEKDWQKAAASSVTIGLGLSKMADEQKKPLKSNEEYQVFLDELVKKAVAK